MGIAYLVITILLASMVTFSGIGKIRRDPHIVSHLRVGDVKGIGPAAFILAVAAAALALRILTYKMHYAGYAG